MTQIQDRAEVIIDRAVKRTPPGKGDSYVLTWEQAVAAVLDALAGVSALQAQVAELEGENERLRRDCNILLANIDAVREATGEGPEDEDAAMVEQIRADLSPARQEGR